MKLSNMIPIIGMVCTTSTMIIGTHLITSCAKESKQKEQKRDIIKELETINLKQPK